MNKKQVLKIFSNVGLAQILPAILTSIVLIALLIVIVALTLNPIFGSRTNVSDKNIIAVTIFCIFSFFSLTGLIAFLISSFHFIRAKQTYNHERLIKGMKYLNWGWLVLSLFIIIMFFFASYVVVNDAY